MLRVFCCISKSLSFACLLWLGLFSVNVMQGAYHLSLPHAGVEVGQASDLNLYLDNAVGIAAVQVQVNFNPDIVEILNVSVAGGEV